ncbi:MAG: hypothetical protein U9N14_05525 [Pseudomonadota bacterium]|nr:hypothetical protein [Pseudomonadota bacterium]
MCLFSKPKMPAPVPTPAPVADTRDEALLRTIRRRARGRATTIVTGGRGLLAPAPVARKLLLGE